MTPPNQLPWTQHQPDAPPSRQALYEYEPLGWTGTPAHSETHVAAPQFHRAILDSQRELALEESDPPSAFFAKNSTLWCQEFGGGSAPVMPLNSARPNSEFDTFPGEFRPWPAGDAWIATDGNQVTTNDSMARNGGSSLWNEGIPLVNFEAPSREAYSVPTYPAGIATTLSEVTLEDFTVTRGVGNTTLWSEGVPSVQLESPLSERRPFSTPTLFHGPMDAVGYNHPPFSPSSNQGQIPRPAHGVNLNAKVVRSRISTPATALEAVRRRVHPSRFRCDYCCRREVVFAGVNARTGKGVFPPKAK